ncbi:hypothetical protein RhiirC2_783867 [Rhizophagus irregularis]|uniref:Uncharacterized protein n=1 Tax=Rhizophagus irregularis TaxID=588596 RepID=A0A2N1MZT5_9GLOM|nr:hypothetical protein RhiirC2_783867 [Rhizophagus irregularis]
MILRHSYKNLMLRNFVVKAQQPEKISGTNTKEWKVPVEITSYAGFLDVIFADVSRDMIFYDFPSFHGTGKMTKYMEAKKTYEKIYKNGGSNIAIAKNDQTDGNSTALTTQTSEVLHNFNKLNQEFSGRIQIISGSVEGSGIRGKGKEVETDTENGIMNVNKNASG